MSDTWFAGSPGFPPRHVVRHPIQDAVTVTVDGWSCTSRAKVPRDGSWVAELDDWSGWWGGRSIVSDTVQSPTGDGVVSGPTRFGARTITLNGSILTNYEAVTAAAIHRAGEAFAAILAGGARSGVLRVKEDMTGMVREVDVKLAQDPDFDFAGWGTATFALYLTAADPLRYGIEETIIRPGQTARVPNAGNIISRPVVDFVGPLSAPTLTANGGTFTLGADVAAGSTLTADMRQRIVWLNGNRTFTPARGFWQNVPEGGTEYTLGGTGSGYARVRRSSAWT